MKTIEQYMFPFLKKKAKGKEHKDVKKPSDKVLTRLANEKGSAYLKNDGRWPHQRRK